MVFSEKKDLFPGSTADIKYEVAPEAEITMAKYYIAKYQQKDYLHVDVEIKNISQKEHRYRVRILLDEGAAIAGLYPRKVKKGAIGLKPGEKMKRKFPMYYQKEPKGLTVMVEVFE